jgi:hypothetical protein
MYVSGYLYIGMYIRKSMGLFRDGAVISKSPYYTDIQNFSFHLRGINHLKVFFEFFIELDMDCLQSSSKQQQIISDDQHQTDHQVLHSQNCLKI